MQKNRRGETEVQWERRQSPRKQRELQPRRQKEQRQKEQRQKEQRRKRRRRARRRFLLKTCAALAVCAVLAVLAGTGWRYLQGRFLYSPERLAEEGYPESLIELLEKNPETKDFVLGYADYEGPVDIDISGEVKQGEIPHFLQWDKRWGYETYGSDFLALTGCGPTCLSMVLCGLSGDTQWNPLEVARWAEEQGYYVDGSGSSWELMTTGAESLGLTASGVTFDEDHI